MHDENTRLTIATIKWISSAVPIAELFAFKYSRVTFPSEPVSAQVIAVCVTTTATRKMRSRCF